jgi:hypothetical protein
MPHYEATLPTWLHTAETHGIPELVQNDSSIRDEEAAVRDGSSAPGVPEIVRRVCTVKLSGETELPAQRIQLRAQTHSPHAHRVMAHHSDGEMSGTVPPGFFLQTNADQLPAMPSPASLWTRTATPPAFYDTVRHIFLKCESLSQKVRKSLYWELIVGNKMFDCCGAQK